MDHLGALGMPAQLPLFQRPPLEITRELSPVVAVALEPLHHLARPHHGRLIIIAMIRTREPVPAAWDLTGHAAISGGGNASTSVSTRAAAISTHASAVIVTIVCEPTTTERSCP